MISASFKPGELRALKARSMEKGFTRAMRRASSTSARDMRSEASKRVRARKRLRVKAVNKSIVVQKNTGRTIDAMAWGVNVRGDTTRLIDYKPRQVRKGVSVSVNKGQRTLVRGAFIATMRSGHKGVFVRKGRSRTPIRELIGSRPVDALNHAGEAEAVATRGRVSFTKTLGRLLDAELEKAGR